MRLTTFLLILALVQASAKGYSQITLHEKNTPFEKVMQSIKKQSGFTFFYDENIKSGLITVDVNNVSVSEALDRCFLNLPVTYQIVDNNVLLKTKESSTTEKINVNTPVIVSGNVFDEQGNPITGVTITIQGKFVAGVTNEKGSYKISAEIGQNLIFSHVGYIPRIYIVKGPQAVDITLSSQVTSLQEVTINKGYYTEKEKLTTGDVTTVKGADILKTPTTNPILALEGRVAGLAIQTNSGLPGATQQILIRGRGSLFNGTTPLYIIDGVPYSSQSLSVYGIAFGNSASPGGLDPLADLNPADIEEITVLKDADATAIYGSRGANGVILITTKKGIQGKAQTRFDLSSSYTGYSNFVKMLNTPQYLEMRMEAFRNDGITPSPTDYDVNGTWDKNRYTDWQKEILGNASHITNLQGSISGGDADTKFIINGGYRDQSTLFNKFNNNMGDQQASFRANIDHTSPNKKLNINIGFGFVFDNNVLPLVDPTGAAISLPPNAPKLFNDDGTVNWENNTFSNPIAGLFQTNQSTTKNLLGNMLFSYNIVKGLNIRASVGYNNTEMNELLLQPGTSFSPTQLAATFNPAQRTASFGTGSNASWIAEPQLSYDRKIGKNKLSLLIGTTFQQTTSTGSGFSATGFTNDIQLRNYAAAPTKTFLTPNYTDYHYTALFARVNYNWNDKYIVNITARRDGSSNFGPANQFGNFGAIGTAWVFTQEPWFKNLSWLSFGKLRGSYGITGNDQITSYSYLSTYSISQYTYGGLVGLNPTLLANPNIQWETNKKLEGGLDLGFLNDRFNVSLNYYRNRSGNQLSSYILPDITGFSSVIANLPALIQNQGFEAVLNTTNLKSKNFSWHTSFNISFNNNKLLSFPGIDQTPYASLFVVGKSLYIAKLYHYTGVDPLTGVYTYQDVNKDGVLNNADYLGDKEIAVKYFGGFDNSFTYKGFQLDVFFQFVKQTGRSYLYSFGAAGNATNKPVSVLDRWQKPGDNTSVEEFTTGSGSAASTAFNNYYFGDNSIVDASYIRLKNATLNYTLPLKWRQSMHLKNTQIYITTDNLLTFTPYVGADPETGGKTLPPMRTVLLGLRLSL